jgi:hypothetical protein
MLIWAVKANLSPAGTIYNCPTNYKQLTSTWGPGQALLLQRHQLGRARLITKLERSGCSSTGAPTHHIRQPPMQQPPNKVNDQGQNHIALYPQTEK